MHAAFAAGAALEFVLPPKTRPAFERSLVSEFDATIAPLVCVELASASEPIVGEGQVVLQAATADGERGALFSDCVAKGLHDTIIRYASEVLIAQHMPSLDALRLMRLVLQRRSPPT